MHANNCNTHTHLISKCHLKSRLHWQKHTIKYWGHKITLSSILCVTVSATFKFNKRQNQCWHFSSRTVNLNVTLNTTLHLLWNITKHQNLKFLNFTKIKLWLNCIFLQQIHLHHLIFKKCNFIFFKLQLFFINQVISREYCFIKTVQAIHGNNIIRINRQTNSSA